MVFLRDRVRGREKKQQKSDMLPIIIAPLKVYNTCVKDNNFKHPFETEKQIKSKIMSH